MEVRSDVRSVHDLGKPHERGIIKEIVLEHDTFERTATVHVAQFGAFDVERDCPFPLGDLHDFACRDEEEFGIRINQGQAMRSTLAFSRVTHFITPPSSRWFAYPVSAWAFSADLKSLASSWA